MPTEEDLKAIVVHKKYSSRHKSKSESRKRKRSSSSGSSRASGGERRDTKSDKGNPDVGFIPSRFLKDQSSSRKSRSSSRRRDNNEESMVTYPGYSDLSKLRGGVKRDRSYESKRDDHRTTSRDERRGEDRSRDDRARDDKDRSRDDRSKDDRRDERKDERKDERRRDEDNRKREPERHDSRSRDDRTRDERSRDFDDKSKVVGHRKENQLTEPHRHKKDASRDKSPKNESAYRRKLREEQEKRRESSADSHKRRPRNEDDEDYDPISDEELAMLEEDAGVIEIYKELEREIRSKRYTANLDHLNFSSLEMLKTEREESANQQHGVHKLTECGYSANLGGKLLTERIRSLAIQHGIDPPMDGAVSASKKTVKQVFKETLSPYIALSSHTDTILRNRLSQTSRNRNVTPIVVTDDPVNNTLLLESVKLFNAAMGTNLEVK